MSKQRRAPKIFFGWWTSLVIGTWAGLGQNFYSYGFSVFFKPLAAELGLTRAVTSVASGIGRIEGGFEAPITGWLSDRFGPKWIIFAGTTIFAFGLLLMYLVHSLWAFYLVWAMVGFGNNVGFAIATDKALANWFIKKRGLAIGLKFVLNGVYGAIMLPIVSWLVTTHGWRMTNVIWALVMFTGLPLLIYFVKLKRPEYYGLLPDGATVEEGATDTSNMLDKGAAYAAESAEELEFTFRQTLKTITFWLLLAGWCVAALIGGAVSLHFVPLLTDMGMSPTLASSMLAIMVFFTIPSRFFGGFLADRLKKERLQFLLAVTFLLMAGGIIAIVLNQSVAVIYVFLFLYGMGSGASIVVRLAVTSRYFGRKAFGTIIGASSGFIAPISFLSPVYAGWIHDTTGNYKTAFITFAAAAVLAAFLMCLVRPPKPVAVVTKYS